MKRVINEAIFMTAVFFFLILAECLPIHANATSTTSRPHYVLYYFHGKFR